jgi:hypothetical protein
MEKINIMFHHLSCTLGAAKGCGIAATLGPIRAAPCGGVFAGCWMLDGSGCCSSLQDAGCCDSSSSGDSSLLYAAMRSIQHRARLAPCQSGPVKPGSLPVKPGKSGSLPVLVSLAWQGASRAKAFRQCQPSLFRVACGVPPPPLSSSFLLFPPFSFLFPPLSSASCWVFGVQNRLGQV